MLLYLDYNEQLDKPTEEWMLREANEGKPEQPEALGILYRTRNYETTYHGGGLVDQPAVLMMELDTCIRAENEHERIQLINQRLRQEFEAQKRENDGKV